MAQGVLTLSLRLLYHLSDQAEVAELADALDSGSSVLNGRGGSSPLFGTLIQKDLRQIGVSPFFLGNVTRMSSVCRYFLTISETLPDGTPGIRNFFSSSLCEQKTTWYCVQGSVVTGRSCKLNLDHVHPPLVA